MAVYNIGRILPIFRGNWTSLTEYDKLDIVYYNGNSYVATGSSKGVLPTNNSYWQIIALKGQKGDTGDTCDISVVEGTNNYNNF